MIEAACWVHARRPFFILADVAANARRKAQGKTAGPTSPLALEAVRRIDACLTSNTRSTAGPPSSAGAVRQQQSAPLVAYLEQWVREQRPKLSRGNDLTKAMTTCSAAGRPLPASSTTAALPLDNAAEGPCAVLRSAENHGCSLAATAVDSAERRYMT